MLTQKQWIARVLCQLLIQLRDPGQLIASDYILGILHGCRMSGSLTEDEIGRACVLITSARNYHYAGVPWPQTKNSNINRSAQK